MAKDSPIQFKGTTLKIIQTKLSTTDPAKLHQALAELTGNSPDFFENELAVLDFSGVEGLAESADWAGIVDLLRQSGLKPVATHGLSPALADAAAAAGLPALNDHALGRQRTKAAEPVPAEPAPAPVETAPPLAETPVAPAPAEPPPRTVILDKPLRSGQRFYAKGSDLIVTAMVSAGAEVIADGNIHVTPRCAAAAWPAPRATPKRASSRPAWKPSCSPSPVFIAPSKAACRPNCCASRPPST